MVSNLSSPSSGAITGAIAGAASRSYYIDRIRVILTAMVIFHHTAITYGAPGGWYYKEMSATPSLSGAILALFVSVNQAYFMGFFFLLSGYFTAFSYERKSPGQFVVDRLIRLGIPLAVFAVLLDPLTNAIAEMHGDFPVNFQSVLNGFVNRVAAGDWYNGPLWFAQALLVFSAVYLVWRRWRKPVPRQADAPMPGKLVWLLGAVGVGLGALFIRQWVPVGKNVWGLQLGYFSSYIFLFAIGMVAWQRNWLERLTWKDARLWAIVSVIAFPTLLITAIAFGRFEGKPVNFAGGLSLPAIVYSFWEPFVAWGIIASYLVWFREHGNRPSKVWEYLGLRAYAVYILHAPVLVAVSVALRSLELPAIAKIAVTGSLACFATLLVSSLVLRIPGARRVV